ALDVFHEQHHPSLVLGYLVRCPEPVFKFLLGLTESRGRVRRVVACQLKEFDVVCPDTQLASKPFEILNGVDGASLRLDEDVAHPLVDILGELIPGVASSA